MDESTAITQLVDNRLADLIDALVEAIDMNRFAEIERVRTALELLGCGTLFSAELRLNGLPSNAEWCSCVEAEL